MQSDYRARRKKKQQYVEFQRLGKLAYDFEEKGDHRACFETAFQAVCAAPTPFALPRYDILMLCQTAAYYGPQFIPKKRYRKLLMEQFVCNDQETILFRVGAAMIVGTLTIWMDHDYPKVGHLYRYALYELLPKSPPEQDDIVILRYKTCGRTYTLRDRLDFHKDDMESWLGANKDYYDLEGGHCCDYCQKTSSTGGELLVCGRCQIVFYCSSKCQSKHWKESHKKSCRKKGEFQIGDRVQLKYYARNPSLSGYLGELLEREVITSPNKQKHCLWKVRLYGDAENGWKNQEVIVQKNMIMRVRPMVTLDAPPGPPSEQLAEECTNAAACGPCEVGESSHARSLALESSHGHGGS